MGKNLNPVIKFLLVLCLAAFGTGSTLFFFMPIKNAGIVLPGIFMILFVLFLYISFFSSRPLFNLGTDIGKTKKVWLVVFAFLFSAALLFSIRGSQGFLLDNAVPTIIVVYLGSIATLSSFVLVLLSLLLKVEIVIDARQVSKIKIIAYAAPSILVWLLYFTAFYPAGMTPDSLAQWDQAHTGQFNDWHPLIYTWFIMLLTSFWDSPAIVSLAQIVIMALIFGYSAYRFEAMGVNKIVIWIMAVLFALSPINGIYSITIWKDVLYSAFLLFFSMVILNIVVTKGKWLESYTHITLFLLAAVGIVFMRHNGFPVFLITLVVLLLSYRKQLKPLLVVFVLIIALHSLITGPVFQALDVVPSDPNEALSIPTQQFATIIINDGKLTEEQRDYLDSIFPIELWKERFHPYNTNAIKFSWKEYDRDIIFDDFKKYVTTWLEVCLQNPKLAVEGFLTHTSLVWQIREPEKPGYTDAFVTNVYLGNEQGIVNTVINPELTEDMRDYLTYTKEELGVIIWRPATYLFMILFFTFVSYLRNDYKSWFVSLPVLLNAASVMAAIPAQDFRYLYANTLLLYLTFIFMFLHYKRSGEPST